MGHSEQSSDDRVLDGRVLDSRVLDGRELDGRELDVTRSFEPEEVFDRFLRNSKRTTSQDREDEPTRQFGGRPALPLQETRTPSSERADRPHPASPSTSTGGPSELGRLLADMEVLWRYGHEQQVLDVLRPARAHWSSQPHALQEIAAFLRAHGRAAEAVQTFFYAVAAALETQNLHAMQASLAAILDIDPLNQRARKLAGSH